VSEVNIWDPIKLDNHTSYDDHFPCLYSVNYPPHSITADAVRSLKAGFAPAPS